jgi:hypothetical protein
LIRVIGCSQKRVPPLVFIDVLFAFREANQ